MEYVGFAKNFRRRFTEHLRFWRPQYTGHALVIAFWSEAEARRLENHLICLLNPEGNRARSKLSWIEREHFDRLREKWVDGDLFVCPGCSTLCERIEGAYVPVVEPEDHCTQHWGAARQKLARAVVDALCFAFGHDPFSFPSGGILSAFFGGEDDEKEEL